MNIPSLSRSQRTPAPTSSAFTLIELLVVISIIAVLAGLLLPVTGAVMENARKTDAKSTELQIVSAVKNYQTEYGVYPVVAVAGATVDTTFDKGGNKDLFNALRADATFITANPTINPRRIVYFEGKDVKNVAAAKGGFVPTGANSPKSPQGINLHEGDLLDPWGNFFYVRIDSDYSDAVYNPYPATDASPTAAITYTNGTSDGGATSPNNLTLLRFGVVAWSPGKNGVMAAVTLPASNYGDDVVSWQ